MTSPYLFGSSVLLTLALLISSISCIEPLEHVDGRIVGGEPRPHLQHPYQVAIYIDTGSGTYFCGGSLISQLYVLTSATCVQGGRAFTILLGTSDLSDESALKVATVTAIQHPRYNPISFEYDIAVLRLHLPIPLNANIRTIELLRVAANDSSLVTACGWGFTSDSAATISNNVNCVDLITIPNQECQLTYGVDAISNSMVCAINNLNGGICSSDTGGPLVVKGGGASNSDVQIGIASFVSQSGCESPYPSGFTRTFSYIEWLKGVTDIPS